MKIYSLYSKSQKRYNLPFFANDDVESVSIVAKMVTAQNDPALICALDDLRLDVVGTFDCSNAMEPIQNVLHMDSTIILDDLHKNLPLPPSIKERIDKYYGGAANA